MTIDWRGVASAHGPLVWRTVYRLLNNYDDALDCYQDVFVDAWKLSVRQPVDHWAALLTTLATRRAIDRLRQRRRSRSRIIGLDDVPEPSDESPSPLGQIVASDLLDFVRSEIALLPGKQAEVFWLSSIEEFTHQKISEQMRIPPGEVRVLLHRARARLQEALETKTTAERKKQ